MDNQLIKGMEEIMKSLIYTIESLVNSNFGRPEQAAAYRILAEAKSYWEKMSSGDQKDFRDIFNFVCKDWDEFYETTKKQRLYKKYTEKI